MERLVEAAAAEMGIDRVELRRRNHIPPEAMPYKAPNGTTYDSGDFAGVLDGGVASSPIGTGFAARKAESRARGRLRGRGISDYLELTGPARPRDGRHPLRAERRRDHDHRHARLRAGPLVAFRAGTGEPARHPVRPDQALAGRQRRTDRRRRHRRLEIDDDERGRDRRGRPTNASSKASRSPPMCWRRRRPTSSSAPAGLSSPAPTARSASWNWPTKLRGGLELPRGAAAEPRHRQCQRRPALGLSQWLPHRRGRGRSRDRHGRGRALQLRQRFRRRHQPAAGHRPGAWRHRAGDRPGVARAHRL